MNRNLVYIISLVFCIQVISAGEVRTWKPIELLDKAELVIIGKPENINETGKKGSIKLGGGRILPIKYFSASVKVVEIVKGVIGKETELKVIYSRIDDSKIVDSHYVHRFHLDKKSLYLLYLKKSNSGHYISALHDEINDSQSAKVIK